MCGLVAIVLAMSVGSVSKADDPSDVATVQNTLNNAIGEGVPLFNNGDHFSCYRIYSQALNSVLPMLGNRPSLQATVQGAMTKAAHQRSDYDKAWTLRYAIDLVLESMN
jgi:hypothetical protein